MKKITLLLAFTLIANTIWAESFGDNLNVETNKDSLLTTALDTYWKELSRTVREGDFEGYGEGYHQDAIIVFATGKNKTSVPLSKALAGWKQGFDDTKAGINKSDVTFRFSQRIGDDTTAHETGIFNYWTSDGNGKNKVQHIIHFEALLIKRNGKWLMIMEHQKNKATNEEWEALKQ